MEASTVVIKVKYGDILRRFNAKIVDGELDFRMGGLTEKIFTLFNFAPDAEIMLTYIDEDGDSVALVDDDDLCDVVKQSLNPLRITVKLTAEKNGTPFSLSTGTSTPLRSPRVKQSFQNPIAGVSEILKTVPEPLRERIVNLSNDLVSKVSAPGISPGVTDLVNYFSKVGLSYLDQLAESQARVQPSAQSDVSESSSTVPESKDSDSSRVDPKITAVSSVGKSAKLSSKSNEVPSMFELEAAAKNVEVTAQSSIGGTMDLSSFKSSGTNTVAGALNSKAAPPEPVSLEVAFNKSRIQTDGRGTIFHRGVRCDGCGVHPITGPRFKSKVKVDYDLCSICFAAIGNENDYFRIDHPAINRHQWSFKGFHDHHARGRFPASPQIQRGHKVKPGGSKLDSRFIQDVNILDGTVVAPLTAFTKIWRMRNNGTVVWPQKTQLVWIGGDKLSNLLSVELEIPAAGLAVDHELDVAVDFISPDLPGRYISYWRMASPSGQKFGQRVWVLIQVDATLKEVPRVGVQGLNLNLPLVNSVLNGPEIFNMELTPLVKDSRQEPDNSNKMVEIVDPVFHIPLPNNEQDKKFPITDSLLVGNGASSSVLPFSTSGTYPIIDLSDIAPPAFSTPAPAALYPSVSTFGNTTAFTEELPEKEEVEIKLLRELEEMGFKQVDLNKEILRMNEYDMEQAVDDLCEVSEWDPILGELQEMGFHNTEMNKKLLKKNNGSIKRVVMDLIAGEK